MTKLAKELERFVAPSGAVAFGGRCGCDELHWNAWCAMFAHQAFVFHELISQDIRIDPEWVKLIV